MAEMTSAVENGPPSSAPSPPPAKRSGRLRSSISLILLILLSGGLAWHFLGKPYYERRSIDALTGEGLTVVDQGFALLITDYSLKSATDKSLRHIRGINRDVTVDLLRAENISNEGLREIRGCSNIRWLKLGGTRIDDDGVKLLDGLSRLETLDLSRLPLTDRGLETLASLNLPELSELNIAYTEVTDTGLQHLGKMKNLSNVSVNFTKVTEEGAMEIKKQIPSLQVLGITTPDEQARARGKSGKEPTGGNRDRNSGPAAESE